MGSYAVSVLLMFVNIYVFSPVTSKDTVEFSKTDCKSYEDCGPVGTNLTKYKSSDLSCFICADSDSKRSKCLYPFPYMFQNDRVCSRLKPCPLSCSGNRGECSQGSLEPVNYAPACMCKDPYYGDTCQFEKRDNQRASLYITWAFKGYYPVGVHQILELITHNQNFSDFLDLKLYVSTEDGYYEHQLGSQGSQSDCDAGSELKCRLFKLNVRFPFKMFNGRKKAYFVTLKDQILGYLEYIKMTVMAHDNVIYDKTFRVLVWYPEQTLKCIAVIELTNCVPNATQPTMFTRPAMVDLVSEVTYVTDGNYKSTSVANEGCAADATFTWKMWRLTGELDTAPPLFQNYTNKVWRFNPFSLDLGAYKVMYEVRNAHLQGVSMNFAYCYITIKSLPLNLVVEGGNDKLIRKEAGLKLSAAQSTDPNMPPSLDNKYLYVTWSCVRVKPDSSDEPMCAPRRMEASKPYFVQPELLTYSAVYNFTVRLWSKEYDNCAHCGVKGKITFVRVEVGNTTSKIDGSIQCIQNCQDTVIPNEVLILKATSENTNVSQLTDLEWTYYKTSDGEELSVCITKEEGWPPSTCLIKEGSLESGNEYTIVVRSYNEGYYARYSLKTESLDFQVSNCTVDPQNGTEGLTFFDIACKSNKDYALLYEFYDRSEGDANKTISFNGRMLGWSPTGRLQGVQLSRGTVIVFVTNSRGMSLKKEVHVQLLDWDVTTEIINELRKNISDFLSYLKDEQRALRLMTLFADILPPEANKNYEFNNLLSKISEISLDTLLGLKMTSSTLYILLESFNKPKQIVLDSILLTSTLNFIEYQALTFSKCVRRREQSESMTSKETKWVTMSILSSLQATLNCKDANTLGVNEDDMSIEDLLALKQSSNLVEGTINALSDVLSYKQSPGQPVTKISTEDNKTTLWVAANDDDYDITQVLSANVEIPVSVSYNLFNDLANRFHGRKMVLQAASIQDNIFWWHKSNVKSNFISASIAIGTEYNELTKIQTLKHPLDMRIKMSDGLSGTIIESSVQQIDSALDEEDLDLNVKIHKLDIKPRSFMNIFFRFPQTNGSLRVSVTKDFRPDYKHMLRHSTTITQQSPSYPHRYHEYDEPSFWYMGIIPGQEIPENETVIYSFELNSTLCQYWNGGSWKSEGCLVGPETKTQEINCQCTHLSIFAASFLVPPQQIDPFQDYKLFLTVFDNPLVVALVLSMLLIYILLCIFLCFKDRKDKTRYNVIVLEDNFPLDKFPYLLAVFTSPRFNAGTTSNVGLRIFGSEANSRAHVLSSSKRAVLKKGCDDWFLIYCPERLGKIENLHLWHNNSGSSPSWFCSKIFVYDLQNKTETKFVVEQWLGFYYTRIKEEQCYPEANIIAVDDHDLADIKRRFVENITLGLRDGHRMLSIFFRHPRSKVTRVQRLSIIMVYVMVAMLCSIMFYKPSGDNEGTDDYQYSVGMKELIISLECLVIGAIITLVVMFSFRRSIVVSTVKHKSSTKSKISLGKGKIETVYVAFVRNITNWIKRPPLTPVHFQEKELLRTRIVWLVIAWVSCVTIITISAYLVMLYGLKLGKIKSQKWLTSVLMTIGEDVLLMGPVEIVVFAALLSIAFQQLFEVNTYDINVDDGKVQDSMLTNEDIEKVILKRNHPKYSPLSDEVRSNMIRKARIRSEWWLVLDFLIATGFLLVICNIISRLWTSYYYTNSHITHMINTNFPFTNSIKFYKVSNVSELENYLSNSFLYVVYNSRWYNKQQFDEEDTKDFKYWTSDCTNRIVGRPRIRQLRVRSVICPDIISSNQSHAYIPRWSEKNEDTNVYAKGWTPGTYRDVRLEDSPWVYREKTTDIITPSLRLYGMSGRRFHNGGYSVILGPKRQDVEQILQELEDERWQNIKTRVVFLELTLFNANKDLYSQVTLVVEYLVSGTVLLTARITSVSIDFNLNVLDVLFVFFILYYVARTLYLINIFGLLNYVSVDINSILHILIIITGIISILLFSTHFYFTSLYAVEFQKSERNSYFEFDSFVKYFLLLQISLCCLLSVAFLRQIRSIQGGVPLLIHFKTFTFSLRWIVWFVLIVVLVFHVFKLFTFLLGLFVVHSIMEILITRKYMETFSDDLQRAHVETFFILKMICVYIINGLLFVLFVYSAKRSKSYVFNELEKFNFIQFFVSRIRPRRSSYRRRTLGSNFKE